MGDLQFDALENFITLHDPSWKELKKTGVKVNKKTKCKLEYFMPSLTKQYPEDLAKWLAKHSKVTSWLVTNKLDGSSLQLTYEGGKPTKLVTRGNGATGGDISFHIPHLNIPAKIPNKQKLVFRCEAVMSQKVFKAKWEGKREDGKFENARNMVNGVLNRKDAHLALKDICIVVLGLYDFQMYNGLRLASSYKLKIVSLSNITPGPTPADLAKMLPVNRKASPYEMDGLVLAPANRVMKFVDADKVSWMTAYKENVSEEDAALAIVEKVIWQTSSNGRLIPKAQIKPIRIGGVTVTNVALHNADWMRERPLKKDLKGQPKTKQFPGRSLIIGPGAHVKVVRSGDVIPKIVACMKPGKLQVPEVSYIQRGVHFVESTVSKDAEVQKLMRFFTKLGIEFIARGGIETCYENGLLSAQDYIRTWATRNSAELEACGLGKVMAKKIYAELDRVFSPGLTVAQFMVCSSMFEAGLGERKLQMVIANNPKDPDILRTILNTKSKAGTKKLLANTPGWQDRTIELFIAGLPAFRLWLRRAVRFIKIRTPAKVSKPKGIKGFLSGKIITFTGYRDLEQEAFVVANGGLVDKWSSKTSILVYKADGKASTKIDQAKLKKIPVITFNKLKASA